METIIAFLAGTGITIVTVFSIFKSMVDKVIDHKISKQMDEHKHSLEMITESARFDYQRKIHDFSLFSSRKHEIYTEIYKELLITKSKVYSLRGLVTSLTFEDYNLQDIKKYMSENKFPEGESEEIAEIWNLNRINAVGRLRSYLRMIKEQEAEFELGKCLGDYYTNEIYMSNNISQKVAFFLEKLEKLLMNYQFPDEDTSEDSEDLKCRINEIEQEIKNEIRNELSIGDYEKY